MQRIFCGTSGVDSTQKLKPWSKLDLEPKWLKVIKALNPGKSPRPLQAIAFGQEKILENRRNIIVSAPTNSGKSLVGLMVLLDAVSQGKRVLLLEPLKALAREKLADLEAISEPVGKILDKKITIKITTGDYRLEDETLFAPPPGGEILIATPERIEALLRNPKHHAWLESIGAVCVDEAHLISSKNRGLTLEFLLTSFLSLPAPPRLILLSATMGNVDQAQSWLDPCDVIRIQDRQPSLEKWVIAQEEEEDLNDLVVEWVSEKLCSPDSSLLIFVYQTRSAQALARYLNEKITAQIETGVARPYHSKMSQLQREQTKQSFLQGECRVLVTTTALSLGMNLPATDVLVRDNTFPGMGKLKGAELLQMMGRAGRGSQSGTASVLVRPGFGWDREDLVATLKAEPLPNLVSAFDVGDSWSKSSPAMPGITPQIASLLSRWHEQGATQQDIEDFLAKSLGGQALTGAVREVLTWLESQWLAYQEPDSHRYFLTVLGRRAVRSVLPLPVASGYAQLLRDFMSLDDSDELLEQWRSQDHLLILDLLSDNSPNLRRYSKQLVQQVDSWCEHHPEQVPLIFRKWMRGDREHSRSIEVLGSLGLECPNRNLNADHWAHQQGYLAMFRTMILSLRAQGVSVAQVERQYGIKDLEGIEEQWRDRLLWLLSGLANVLEVRTFYFHLKEDCQADYERVKRVKVHLLSMRFQVFRLQAQLKYCSPLGGLLGDIQRMNPRGSSGVGVQSMRALEAAGVCSLKELLPMDIDKLKSLGIRTKQAQQIRAYVAKRVQV